MPFQIPIAPADRDFFVRCVCGTAAMVVGYAILHDQLLIRVAPTHFTEYHPQIFPTENLTLLAVGYAVVASTGAGMLLGMLFFGFARLGRWPKAGLRSALLRVGAIIGATEVVALAAGLLAVSLRRRGIWMLPRELYPDATLGITFTQTVQLFAYGGGAVFSAAALASLLWARRRAAGRIAP